MCFRIGSSRCVACAEFRQYRIGVILVKFFPGLQYIDVAIAVLDFQDTVQLAEADVKYAVA